MVGNRILVLSPHPGRVKAELNADAVRPHGAAAATASRGCHAAHSRPAVRRAASRRSGGGASADHERHPPAPPVRPRIRAAAWRTAAPCGERPLAVDLGAAAASTGFAQARLAARLLALVWEIDARWHDNPLLLPTFSDTARRLVDAIACAGCWPSARWTSIRVLLKGYAIGGGRLAIVLTIAGGVDPHRRATCCRRSPPCSTRCPRSPSCRWHCCGSGSARAA